jgi:hypothetical protein
MPSNDETLDIFFDIANGTDLRGTGVGTTHYHDSAYLIANVYSSDSPGYPCVGITDHGPQFIGSAAIQAVTDELFNDFDVFVLLPQVSKVGKMPVVSSQRLYSKNDAKDKMISIQTVMHGTQIKQWFVDDKGVKKKGYSSPISPIQPDGYHVMEIPVSLVFTFDDKYKVRQLSMYFDRYKMQQQLSPASFVNPGAIASAIQAYAERKPEHR